MPRLLPDELEVLRAAIQIYVAWMKPTMTAQELVALRYRAFDEARAMYEHVRSVDLTNTRGSVDKMKRELFRENLNRLGKIALVAQEMKVSHQAVYQWLRKWGRDFVKQERGVYVLRRR